MRGDDIIYAPASVLSALDWWRLAGVDVAVDEAPRDWLARARPAPPVVPQPAKALPDTLDALRAAFIAMDIAGAGEIRLAPEGDPASGLMLLVDLPEPGDAEAGILLCGELGRLFDRMLAAIGRDRASVYLSAMLPARPAGGRIDAALAAEAEAMTRRHVALAAPRLLLLCGDAPCRALLGTGFAEARNRLHEINQGGAKIAAVATFHPRFLLQRPALKADAWKDLRLLLGELDR